VTVSKLSLNGLNPKQAPALAWLRNVFGAVNVAAIQSW